MRPMLSALAVAALLGGAGLVADAKASPLASSFPSSVAQSLDGTGLIEVQMSRKKMMMRKKMMKPKKMMRGKAMRRAM